MTSTKSPFGDSSRNDELRPIWKSIFSPGASKTWTKMGCRYTSAVSQFTNVILAARAALPPLKKIVMETIPIEIFIEQDLPEPVQSKIPVAEELSNLCKDVEILDIGFRHRGRPCSSPTLAQMMKMFLACLQNVRVLGISQGAVFAKENAFETVLIASMPRLEVLRVGSTYSRPQRLLCFIIAHRTTFIESHLSRYTLSAKIDISCRDSCRNSATLRD